MLVLDRSFPKSDRRFREIWRKDGRGDSGARMGGTPVAVVTPQVAGDNYVFVDVAADKILALNDIAVTLLNYPITVVGAAGAEQLNIDPGVDYPTSAAILTTGTNYQFSSDNYLRLFNTTSGAHWHKFCANLGSLSIGARIASSAAAAVFNPGYNFKFITSPTVSLYLLDEITSLWVKPWVRITEGVPVLDLEPT